MVFEASNHVQSLSLDASNLPDVVIHAFICEIVKDHVVDDGGDGAAQIHEQVNSRPQVVTDLLHVEVLDEFKTYTVVSLRVVWVLH